MSDRASELSWLLLEYKFAYYFPSELHIDWQYLKVSDDYYDTLEAEYEKLTGKKTVVGFPEDTPSGRLVRSKLTNSKYVINTFIKDLR